MPKFSNEEYARATIANADREELQEAQEEVEQLESQLTEARAEIERFKTRAMERAIEANERDARIAELEADVVWAVEMNVGAFSEFRSTEGKRHAWIEWTHDSGEGDEVHIIEVDGTPADILRAVREARNGVS